MNLLSRFKTKSKQRRRSLALNLEPLEGRQLMATLAATTAFSSTPVVFTLGSDGTVFVNQQRPTNDPTSPYKSAGLVALPGLQASSIAAFHTINGFPEVVATTGTQSYVYRNVEQQTNNPLQPYAWSGWQAISNYVATSVVTGQTSNTAGIFIIGGDANVYEDVESTASGGGTFSGFQSVPGLSLASISVANDGSDYYRIFGTTGAQSYVSQATTTATFGSNGTTITTSPWTTLSSNFVTSTVYQAVAPTNPSVGSGQNFPISLFVTGGDGRLYSTTLTSNGVGSRSASSFQLVGNPSQVPVAVVSATATLSSSGTYQTILALGKNGVVYENQAIPVSGSSTSFTYSGWVPLNDLIGTSIVAVNDYSGGPMLVARSTNGVTTFKQAALLASPGTASSPVLNAFTNAVNLLVAYHPLAVTTGVTGKPVVVTVGNDGTVYVAQDTTATSSSTTTDTYSGYTALPGLNATSISATTEPNGIAVFAMSNSLSYVYVNQYRPTGNTAQPYAWSGWAQAGLTPAQSIAAVTAGGSSSNTPTLFVNPTSGSINVYQATSPANPTLGYGFSQAPTTLTGLTAATMSVKATANGIEVAALTGPQSYPAVNLDVSGSTGQPTFAGWATLNTYVANRAIATTGVGGIPAVAVNSSSGQQAFSEDLSSGTSSSSFSAFRQIPIPFSTDPGQTAPSGYSFQELTSITYKNSLGGAYFDVFSPKNGSVYGFGFTAGSGSTGQQFTGNPTIGTIQVSSLATTPDFTDPSLFAGGDDGRIYVNQGVLSNSTQNPYTYMGWVALGSLPS